MRIAVNGWRVQGKRTGIARYVLDLVRHWTPERLDGRFDGATFYVAHDADRDELRLPPSVSLRTIRSDRPMLVWENTSFARAARDDVAFHPSFSIPFVRRGRTVVTIHDLVMEKHPELFPSQQRHYNRLYRWSARHATLVLTDSQASADDLERLWGIPPERIRVVYLAPDAMFAPRNGDPAVAEVRQRLVGEDAPFFLFVGKLSGRRNIALLLEAFAELRRRRPDLPDRLLVVGQDIHGVGVTEQATRLGVNTHVCHHDYVSDDDLALLYAAARAYVMPAAYETTSLPLLEAQASGTPVMTVRTAGMQEITGGAAVLVDRLEVRDLADALERLAVDAELRDRLRENGLRNAARFTWSRSSEATLDALQEAAAGGARR